jgi:hypothetical protein
MRHKGTSLRFRQPAKGSEPAAPVIVLKKVLREARVKLLEIIQEYDGAGEGRKRCAAEVRNAPTPAPP